MYPPFYTLNYTVDIFLKILQYLIQNLSGLTKI